MIEFANGKRGTVAVVALLIFQTILFVLSMDAFMEISAFCTGPASSALSLPFGLLHLLFIGLFLMGLASLAIAQLRFPYIALLTLALLMLAAQVLLVWNGVLLCDGP